MKPVQTFDNFPSFANAGSRQAPGDAKYSLGFVAADTLPAEWVNYFFHGATKGVSDLNSAAYSIWNEMASVLSANNITPDANDNTQLLQAIQKMMSISSLAAHPVGSLYWTSSTENPAVTFGGGTWTQIKDKFILAAGDTYTNGATGGAATVTLTTNEMPSHSHGGATGSGGVDHTHSMDHTHDVSHVHEYTITPANISQVGGAISDISAYGATATLYTGAQPASTQTSSITYASEPKRRDNHQSTYDTGLASAYAHTHTITSNGGDQPHENMPPYVVKYCWERTA